MIDPVHSLVAQPLDLKVLVSGIGEALRRSEALPAA